MALGTFASTSAVRLIGRRQHSDLIELQGARISVPVPNGCACTRLAADAHLWPSAGFPARLVSRGQLERLQSGGHSGKVADRRRPISGIRSADLVAAKPPIGPARMRPKVSAQWRAEMDRRCPVPDARHRNVRDVENRQSPDHGHAHETNRDTTCPCLARIHWR